MKSPSWYQLQAWWWGRKWTVYLAHANTDMRMKECARLAMHFAILVSNEETS